MTIRKICNKCGFDATYFEPKWHYPKDMKRGDPFKHCTGLFVEKDVDMRSLEEKLKDICLKTGNEMKKIDVLPTGADKLMQRAIALRLFYSEVCVLVVPQDDSSFGGKT